MKRSEAKMPGWNYRSDAEWCDVMHRINKGHVPMTRDDTGKDAYDLAYWEGVWMRKLFAVKPTRKDTVLDLGCGNGRLAIGVLPYGCQYIGLDPVPECIDFCRDAFSPWAKRYRFDRIDVYNRYYYPQGTVQPIDFRIPLDDASVTWAVAVSVFTHLCTLDVARHYVEEMLRVLKPGGILYTTWFKSPPNEPTSIIERTVFLETEILELLGGLEWIVDERGDTTSQHDQWRVWTKKR